MNPPLSREPFPPRLRPVFRAFVRVAVPDARGFDQARWDRVESIVADALAARPASVRRQVALFLRAVDALARVRYLRGLASLSEGRALALLQALERSPVAALRRGVWGVRTLAFMGCYADPAARAGLGYAAALRGWRDRGGGRPWPEREGAAPPEDGVLLAEPEGHPDA